MFPVLIASSLMEWHEDGLARSTELWGSALSMTRAEMTGGEGDAIKPALARRVVIENVQPQVDCGRFPIKRTIGDRVEVTADIFADGHDVLYAILRHRSASRPDWEEVPMEPLVNDRWQAEFRVNAEGRHLIHAASLDGSISVLDPRSGKKI